MNMLSRREFVERLSLAAGASLVAANGVGASDRARAGLGGRNIVFFLVDDMRYDAMGCVNAYYTTPNMDALAAQGALFENAFVTTSLCSPSRASILSGLYAHRHGILDNETRFPDGVVTFPRALHDAGYATAFVGKWHMGGASDAPQPGFDRWVSFRGQGQYVDQTFNVDGQSVSRKGYTSDLITEYACEFLAQPRQHPSLLYVSHKAVHAPFTPAPRHAGSYKDRAYPHPATMANTEENYRGQPDWVRAQRDSWHGVDGMYNGQTDFDTFVRDYAETLRGVDDSLGRIVATLRERGLLESTLIVITSDNGFLFGEHGLIDKRCMYGPSIRVPLIVHCPELIATSQRRQEMILNIDLAPTFMAAAGLPVPSAMQGQSFLPLFDNTGASWREAFLYEYFWERSFPQTPTVLGVRTAQHAFMQFHGVWDRYALYDLKADPEERVNLLADFIVKHEGGALDALIQQRAPEPVRQVFVDMRKRLNALLKETGCAAEPSWMPRIQP